MSISRLDGDRPRSHHEDGLRTIAQAAIAKPLAGIAAHGPYRAIGLEEDGKLITRGNLAHVRVHDADGRPLITGVRVPQLPPVVPAHGP